MTTEPLVWPEHHHPTRAPVRADAVMSRSCANVIESLTRRGFDIEGAGCDEDLLALAHAVGMYDEACASRAESAKGVSPALPMRRAEEAIGPYIERLTRDAHRLAHHGCV